MDKKILQLIAYYLEGKEFHFTKEEEHNVIKTGLGGLDNMEGIKMLIVVDNDGHSIGVRAFDFCKFPADKKEKMYQVCSQSNRKYRWASFCVDEDDNTVTVAIDAIVTAETCGQIAFELLGRMAAVADSAYPDFMKALWA